MLLGFAVASVLVLVLYALPSLLVGPDEHLTTAERLKAENDVRTTLLQALAGAILLAGLYFTGRTYLLNREGQITERFTRAIDQLGEKESLDVRLGGIYALERIAEESHRDYWPVMEVLTAFVRERTFWTEVEDEKSLELYPKPKPDVQAVLTVLSRRTWTHESEHRSLDLRQTDLRGANLQGAHLKGADLSHARLEQANLGRANLEGADLSMAYLDAANLDAANLKSADLTMTFLKNVNLLRTVGLTAEQVRNASIDRSTELPPGMRSELPPEMR